MKRVGLLLVAALMLAGCAGKPIYNPENRAIPLTAQQFPLERIESVIIEAGQSRQWKFTREAPGHLSAVQTVPKHSAVVDIYFDQRTYRIVYRSSMGLDEKNGTIHSRYNIWVRNLERDIDTWLTNASLIGQ